MQSSNSNRRSFLTQMGGALTAPLLLSRCSPQPDQARRPNILFCISDDQSYPHAGIYGTDWTRTLAFDRIAREGVVFHNAFVSTPSCCPSRGSVLSGQDFYRLREASMNHTVWPPENDIPLYTDLLGDAGYHVGYTGKGWGPGNWQVAGREHSPSGPAYNDIRLDPPGRYLSDIDYSSNFSAFLDQRPADTPFCFWTGFVEPHREFEQGIGARHGKDPSEVDVPGFYPEAPEIRGDLTDYAYEIEYYDGHLARMLAALEEAGELDNTLIVVTSDNGMAFPRAKATLYDYGTRMPLAVRWGDRVTGGQEVRDFVSFTDFAPTFLEAAGVPAPEAMTGRSLVPLLTGSGAGRDYCVSGIERHFPGSRPDGGGYPMRSIRTSDYLYIRNLEPDASPVGDKPGPVWPDDDPTGGYGDTDGGPTKTFLVEHEEEYPELFAKAFGKRPVEELYRVADDPYNLNNLADDPAHAEAKQRLSAQLDDHLRTTADPRATGHADLFDEIMKRYPVLGSNNPSTEQSR